MPPEPAATKQPPYEEQGSYGEPRHHGEIAVALKSVHKCQQQEHYESHQDRIFGDKQQQQSEYKHVKGEYKHVKAQCTPLPLQCTQTPVC